MVDGQNSPAFPQYPGWRGSDPDCWGMSLRDWFAGQALAGIAGNQSIVDVGSAQMMRLQAECAAQMALMIADALLAARQEPQS